ncbi:HD domain-containing protein [Solitalea sp. MAHUQ-68]|uniref:HD domain-containing protein n=1 Tax=Solitalea agri TaxID=2953739 RepID=A0A9X2JC60_9SPHI|nr:HD domain-containing protein [Solitalea agri]MCO4292179.1 HD domain-containing protein [Solitalea agri]
MYEQIFELMKAQVSRKLDHLDKHLTYHCKEHTFDVLEQSIRIAKDEGVTNSHQLHLLKVAALYHDSGFLETYADHETHSCMLFLSEANRYSFTDEDKERITELIMATKIPQDPHNLLERIICDADLDYLGRDDFYKIGDTLRLEFLHYSIVGSDDEWEALQLKFLMSHHYHTHSSQQLREPVKQHHLKQLQ